MGNKISHLLFTEIDSLQICFVLKQSEKFSRSFTGGGSPGLAVMGGDSNSEGSMFKS